MSARLTLLARLIRAIGPESAPNELRWMQQACARTDDSERLEDMVARREGGEPLQYILGTQPFGPLELLVRPPTLIPRPETEDWALRVARELAPTPKTPARVLDLCTGSGCIPLLLCSLWPRGSVRAVGVDISTDALALARDNAREVGIRDDLQAVDTDNVFQPMYGDLSDPAVLASTLPLRPYTLVTANPPYIPKEEYDGLDGSVRNWEDRKALLGTDSDGLGMYRTITELVRTEGVLQKRGAMIALEVGKGQAGVVQDMVGSSGVFAGVEIWKDPWDVERVVVGRTRN
ncbi:S-adenosyl-L-methionine-dependent methyltransferase [Peniophora sp. CONT]|nr:S-adenosyl-L-methionine-dependent methyltransferase [Peniophora sp. CONT]